MFETIQLAPPDPILGLTEAFNQDPNPNKINLSVGVFKDAQGKTPVLRSVKEAERRLMESEQSKGYKPIHGDPALGRQVRELLFGQGSELVDSGRSLAAHTPGGTGALRVVADFLSYAYPEKSLWLSDPTWANHPKIFEAAGIAIKSYPYLTADKKGLNFEGLKQGLSSIPAGDAVLLHACCHNPSGVDPTAAQWAELSALLSERKLLPVVDFAYQGFGRGLEEDAEAVRILSRDNPELFVCSSFSKNFGLYNERTGALTLLASNKTAADAVLSQLKTRIRTNYSNPPAHGGEIVKTILGDAELRRTWEQELADMRERIHDMRLLLANTLRQKGAKKDFGFITGQQGMFSFSGLSPEQVGTLRDKFGIYIVGSGRINVAGITPQNIGPLTDAIVSVL